MGLNEAVGFPVTALFGMQQDFMKYLLGPQGENKVLPKGQEEDFLQPLDLLFPGKFLGVLIHSFIFWMNANWPFFSFTPELFY